MQILPCEPQDFCPCPRCSEELECFQTKSGKLRWKHVNGDHSRCSLDQFQYTVDNPKVASFKKMFIEHIRVDPGSVIIKTECRFCDKTDVPFGLDGFEIGGDTLAYVSKDDSWIEWGAVATSPTRRICFCFYDTVYPQDCEKRNDNEWYAIPCTEFPKIIQSYARKNIYVQKRPGLGAEPLGLAPPLFMNFWRAIWRCARGFWSNGRFRMGTCTIGRLRRI